MKKMMKKILSTAMSVILVLSMVLEPVSIIAAPEGDNAGGNEPTVPAAEVPGDGAENDPEMHTGEVAITSIWKDTDAYFVKFYIKDPDTEVDGDEYIVLGSEPKSNNSYDSGWKDATLVLGRLPIAQAISISSPSSDFPEEYWGKTLPIKEIGPYCFYGASGLYGVEIPEGIERIGERAFSQSGIGQSNGGTVNIPASVTYIGQYAMAECNELTTVTATSSDKLLTVDSFAFSNGANSSTSLNLSGGVHMDRPLAIGDNAFCNSKVASLEIPQAESIGDKAFYGAALDVFEIPATLTEIGEQAFSKNTGSLTVTYQPTEETDLPALNIKKCAFSNTDGTNNGVVSVAFDPNKSVSIGESAFYNNKNMSFLSLGGAVEAEKNAFMFCGTEAATHSNGIWPEGLSAIGNSAFEDCKLLGDIDLSEATQVGNKAFAGSTVTSVTLPASSAIFGTSAFSTCEGLTSVTIPETWERIPNDTFKTSGLETVTVLGNTVIGENAFREVTTLTSVDMPNVETVEKYAFYHDSALSEIVASGAVSVGAYAFHSAALEHLDLPNATTLGEASFYSNKSLLDAHLPKATAIPKQCFGGNNKLQTVYMPEVTQVGNSAFSNCSSLLNTEDPTSPDYNEASEQFRLSSAITIGPNAFDSCKALKNVKLDAATKIDGAAFSYCTALEHAELDAILTIGNSAFKNCTHLETVEMDTVQTIGESAFQGDTALLGAEMDAATEIMDSAFKNCTALETVSMENIRSIGDNAFENTGKNESEPIVFSSGITYIGSGAFLNSCLIGSVDMTDMVLSRLGDSAFAYSSITEVKLPKKEATNFEEGVFQECVDLLSVTVPVIAGGYTLPGKTFLHSGSEEGDRNISIGTLKNVGRKAFKGSKLLDNSDITVVGTVYDEAFRDITVQNINFNNATVNANAFNGATTGNLSLNNTKVYGDAFVNAQTGTVDITGSSVLNTFAFHKAKTGSVQLKDSTANSCAFAEAEITVTVPQANALTMENATVKAGAFANAKLNGDVQIIGNGTVLEAGAFAAGVYDKSEAKFCYLKEDIPETLASDDWSFTTPVTFGKLKITGTNTRIGDYAFLSAEFTSLEIAESATGTVLGNYAFAKVAQAANAVLENGETAVVVNNDTLTEVKILTSDIVIRDYVFNNRVKLSSLTLPANEPANLGFYIFANCDGITGTVDIPEAWTYLPTGFFYGCQHITCLNLPENLNRVGAYVFTAKGTPASHVEVHFESAGSIHIDDNAFRGIRGEEKYYSWLEIFLLNKRRYSVDGFAGGWGAWEIEKKEYWIHWMDSSGEPDCYFAEPRIILNENNTEVTDSNLSSFVEISVRIASGMTLQEAKAQFGNFFDQYGMAKSVFDEKGNCIIDYVLKEQEDGTYSFYSVSRVTLKAEDDITDYDYLYSLYYKNQSSHYAPAWSSSAIPAQYLSTGEDGDYSFNIVQYVKDQFTMPEVDTIGSGAFMLEGDKAATGFIHIYIPDTVTSVESYAFTNQGELEYLTNRNGDEQTNLVLSQVSDGAFLNCESLTSFQLSSAINHCVIGNSAFRNCRALTGVDWTIVDSIGEYAFADCVSLATLSLDEVSTIGAFAFTGCAGLQTVGMGQVGIIGSSAFADDDALVTVKAAHVDRIGEYAFSGCGQLATVHIDSIGNLAEYAQTTDSSPAEIKETIGNHAFSSCPYLADFQIVSGAIYKIGDAAFAGASSENANGSFRFGLKDDGEECIVNCIGGEVFRNAQLHDVYFDTVSQISGYAFRYAFRDNGSTLEINNMTGKNGSGQGKVFENGFANANVNTIRINSGDIADIKANAFNNLPNVTTINFGVTKIGTVENGTFSSLPNVQTIAFDDVTNFGTGAAVIATTAKPKILRFGNVQNVGAKACNGVATLQTLSFADVKNIGANAFQGCRGLQSAVISGAICIGNSAFEDAGAANATKMNLPDDTLTTIGGAAFRNCKLIGVVPFPSGDGTSVGKSAFEGSTVTQIQFRAAPPATMGTAVFNNCDNLPTVAFPNGDDSTWTEIPEETFYDCDALTTVDLGSVKTVGVRAFKGCDTLADVAFGRVRVFSEESFADCGIRATLEQGHTSALPDTVSVIGSNAFAKNIFITTANLTANPMGVTVHAGAFYDSTLSSLDIPRKEPVGPAAFAKTKLTELSIPNTWNRIPDYTFAGCNLVLTVTIGGDSEVGPEIGQGAFSGCTALNALTIDGNSTIDKNAFSDVSNVSLYGGSVSFAAAFTPGATIYMDAVQTINESAFQNCANVTRVSMEGAQTIGTAAFKNCKDLYWVKMTSAQYLGDMVFDGCTSLAQLNFDRMHLQNHTVYRQSNENYTAQNGWKDTETQYSSAIATSSAIIEGYLNINPEAISSTAIAEYFLYEGHVFSMCQIPSTVLAIGANAFRGCPIKNLYIADVNAYYVNANEGQDPYVNSGANIFNKEAFNGIGCQLDANGEVKKDANGNNVLCAGQQDYIYIFVQHSLNKVYNGPWASNALIEWDDGIIGSSEYGLYYRYTDGTIVSVYDQREVIETPESLPDALMRQHAITGFEEHCFFGSNVKSLILNENIDISDNIQQSAFHIPGANPPAVPNIYILQYETPEKKAAIDNALKDSNGNIVPGVHVEWLEDPEIHFPVYTSVDAASDEEVVFDYTFEQSSSGSYEFLSSSAITSAEINGSSTIGPRTALLGMVQQQMRYGSDGVQVRRYLAEDTDNGGQSFTYRFTQDMSNTDWYGCDYPEIFCTVTFTRDNDKSRPTFSINYTPVFEFYAYDANNQKKVFYKGTDGSYTFVNAGAKAIYLVYVNSAPAGFTAAFSTGMLQGTEQAVAMVRKYPVIIQGGTLTCTNTSGESRIFAGWALTNNATTPDFDTPYMTFKNGLENVQTRYEEYITQYNGEDVIYLYPVWKTPGSKTISTNFSMTLDKVIDENQQIVSLDLRYLPKQYGYHFTGYYAEGNTQELLLTYADNQWIWSQNAANNNRYVYNLSGESHWYDQQFTQEETRVIMANLIAGWTPIASPRFRVVLHSEGTTEIEFYTEYNNGAFFASAEGDATVTGPVSEFGYWTAEEGGVKVINSDGTLVAGVTGWTTEEINGQVRWVSPTIGDTLRTLYEHKSEECVG